MNRLRKDGHVSQAEVDAAKTDLDSTDARILALREQVSVAERQAELEQTNLDNTVIRAPFDGIAISKDAQPGEMVSPVSAGGGFTRTGIGTIVDMKSLEIEVDVNEAYINRVTPHQPVVAVLDAYPDWQIPGHVITTFLAEISSIIRGCAAGRWSCSPVGPTCGPPIRRCVSPWPRNRSRC